jgi:hypothetical protein
MTLYSIIQYLKYRWRAKGRHGTHSPFVYDFIEKILHDTEIIERKYIVEYRELPLRFENIISRIAAYNKYSSVVHLPPEEDAKSTGTDLLLLKDTMPGDWPRWFDKYFDLLKNESTIAVAGIHKTREHGMMWKKLRTDERVRMSIDLYGIGLLFFRKEFKVKQDFILKY